MKRLAKRLLRGLGLRPSEWERWRSVPDLDAVPVPEPRDAVGTLTVWASAPPGSAQESVPLRTTWVPGASYDGMHNNDLRGYLDGRFQNGWNQVGQSHVRVGRLAGWVEYGEHELFRVLHRWSGISLPPGATVRGAELALSVERGPDQPLTLQLYRVVRDWNPGAGGVAGDNVSPPAEGEAWWNEAAHGSREWGLPGVGYASADELEADTELEPLAGTRYEPGNAEVVFSSSALADYCNRSVAAGDALRFLIKLADVQEDVPGALVTLYAEAQGDDRTLDRRPRLTLDWDAPGRALLHRSIRLEHGRSVTLDPMPVATQGWRWLQFSPEPESGPLRLEWSQHPGGAWHPAVHPFESPAGTLHVRTRAVVNPVEWGSAFAARFRDTWVRSAPPEEQEVPFYFTSPTGVRHEALARFEGDATWAVTFVPDEVGPWRYRWTHVLADPPYKSAPGSFDVVVTTREQALAALGALAERARQMGVRTDPVQGRRMLVAFSRVERAVMALETPETWRSPGFTPVAQALDEARKALWGKDVPATVPLEPITPPEWARREGDETPAEPGSAPAEDV